MGQAKNKNKNLDDMTFTERLKHDADGIVKHTEYLVANGVGGWMMMEFPEGVENIVFVLPTNIWEVTEGNKLRLKEAKVDLTVSDTESTNVGEG